MKIIKIAIIIFLLHMLGFGIFFGFRKFESSKKTVNVGIAQLAEEKKNNDKIEPQEQIENVQENIQAPIPEKQLSDSVKNQDEIKVETKKTETVSEKKIEEPEKANPPAGGESKGDVGKIFSKLVSWGFTKSSGRKIDTVIVHTSYNSLGGDEYDADKIIDIYKQYEVSAHYLILRNGEIYQLVVDQNISWHAGASEMPDGRKNVNDFSIGIEVINTKDDKFTDEQYSALNSLIGSLKKKYEIKNILGHDDIAPGRKTDPWGIQWNRVNR